MTVDRFKEEELINMARRLIRLDKNVIHGSGDDCAVLKFDRSHYQLFTCDMLVEGVDFTRKDKAYLIGRKAIAVSLSDIAACAGVPTHCLVSVGIPAKTPIEFVKALFKGLAQTAAEFKVNLAGGDLSRAERIIIDVAMLGLVEKKSLLLRSSAKKGDLIFVSGKLGGSIRGKHLKFTPRLKEARFLAANFKIHAMCDISDGLAVDLWHILKASNAGAELFEETIPLSSSASGLNDALFSGEDFELLFTLAEKEAALLLRRKDFSFRKIGRIVGEENGLTLIGSSGKIRIPPKGFDHFNPLSRNSPPARLSAKPRVKVGMPASGGWRGFAEGKAEGEDSGKNSASARLSLSPKRGKKDSTYVKAWSFKRA